MSSYSTENMLQSYAMWTNVMRRAIQLQVLVDFLNLASRESKIYLHHFVNMWVILYIKLDLILLFNGEFANMHFID